MHILDTDTFTHIHKKTPKVLENLEKVESNDLVGITIVTRAEVLRGRLEFLLKANDRVDLEKAQRLLADSETLLGGFSVIPFDEQSLAKSEELKQSNKYGKIGHGDLLIASICISKGAIIVTRNTKHFKQFPNLKVTNWLD